MSVQRVVVVRTGGFAGIRREAEIDDPERAAAFAQALHTNRSDTAGPRPDGFSYRITVVSTTGTRSHDLDEAAMDGTLRAAVRVLFA